MTLEDEAEGWIDGALVRITPRGGGETITRPAAFVWPTPSGIEWVEPSYADPWGAATAAYHARVGRRDGYLVETDSHLVEVLPFDPAADAQEPAAEALLWFAGWLRKSGTSWAAERSSIRLQLTAGQE